MIILLHAMMTIKHHNNLSYKRIDIPIEKRVSDSRKEQICLVKWQNNDMQMLTVKEIRVYQS